MVFFLNRVFFLGLFYFCSMQGVVITNANDAGMLGDSLFNYIKAKYIAHKYCIPFVLTPFRNSDKFILYSAERHVGGGYAGNVSVRDENQLQIRNGYLHSISYYCKMRNWISDTVWAYGCGLDVLCLHDIYADIEFHNDLKRLIKLRDESNILALPSGMITVAVHVRKPSPNSGDGLLGSEQFFNTNSCTQLSPNSYPDQIFPYKFPPDQYYVDQIRNLSNILNNKPMYVFIFTEFPKSSGIVDLYRQAVGKENITFACRDRDSSDLAADDMIAMTKFDCLIRSHSNFSQIAHFLGNYKIVIYPKHAFWRGNRLIVDEVGIVRRD